MDTEKKRQKKKKRHTIFLGKGEEERRKDIFSVLKPTLYLSQIG